MPKKGSYLYYGQPFFEDNSFLLEEAFTQEKGILQNILNAQWDHLHRNDYYLSFSQEIPLTNLTHQLSYTINYSSFSPAANYNRRQGLGDILLSYHPMITGEKQWIMIVPRFSIIIPTGKSKEGLGSGGWGGQFNLALSKRISKKIMTHYNIGFTQYFKYDRYISVNGKNTLAYEKDLNFKNYGASVIWFAGRKTHLLLEYTSNFITTIGNDGSLLPAIRHTLSPGLRYCFDNGYDQWVPGIGVPFILDGHHSKAGLFIYLSFEPDYLPFYKPKTSR